MESKVKTSTIIKWRERSEWATRIKEAAYKKGVSVSEFVRWIVHEAVATRGPQYVATPAPQQGHNRATIGPRQQEEVLRSSSPESAKNKQKQETSSSSEAKAFTGLLVSLMRENMPDMKPIPGGYIRDWEHEAELMHRRDGRSWSDAEAVLRWCQSDGFWKANIRSISKFRKKYEQLCLKMEAQNGSGRKNQPGLTRAQRADAAFDEGLKRLGVDGGLDGLAPDVRPALPEGGRQSVGAGRPGDLRQGSIRVVVDGPEPEV